MGPLFAECTGHSHSLAPDKKQFEKEIRLIDEEIKEKEAHLVCVCCACECVYCVCERLCECQCIA